MRQYPFVARAAAAVGATLVATVLAPRPAFAQANDVPSDFEIAPDDDVKPAPAPAGKADEGGTTRKIGGEPGADAAGGVEPPGESHGVTLHARGQGSPSLLGSYRVRVSYNWPNFNDGLKFYKQTYGDPTQYPEIGADWYAWDWYATLGIGFRLGYYSADGHAAACANAGQGSATCQSPQGLSASQITIDPNGPTTLTLIPMQMVATAEFTPFERKWVVIDGWFGYERTYWQETRNPPPSASTSTTAPTTTTTGTSTTGTSTTGTPTDTTLTNAGWSSASTIGVSANILLNGLDASSAASLRGPMGLGYIYLSPSIEYVRTLPGSNVPFGRTVYAIGFTFESVN